MAIRVRPEPSESSYPMTKRIISRKTIIAAVVTALVLGTGAAAYAFWTAGGSGSGTAGTGTTVPLTVNQTSTIIGVAPGVAALTLAGTFDNSNEGPVYVTSVTASITSVTLAPDAAAGTCTAADYTLSSPVMTVGANVAAGSGVGTWTGATIVFNTTAANQDACKGATVNFGYTVI
jgi:hypothetical protein